MKTYSVRDHTRLRFQSGKRLVTFETQARSDGTWRTDAIFDDRPAAVNEAERILSNRRTPAVRVIQVLYDPATAECTEHTVFRATCFDEENQHARKRVPDQEIFEWGADGRQRHSLLSRYDVKWLLLLALSIAALAAAILVRALR